ncbi:MAG: glycosyltransferase family 2 protein [Flavipsychrobacter sp.]|nr:glycosyltransferase family 2 protein [Flavipsychrobacter sp.]
MPKPTISICIPAYKRTRFLTRLLESIEMQTYKDFEVVITDDSNDEQVADLCKIYANKFPLRYQKNPVQLGAAANWNRCMQLGEGTWLKIMHDDDWFATKDALSMFAAAAKKNIQFIWCNYFIKNDSTQKVREKKKPESTIKRNIQNPFLLFGENIIGPPSCVMVHRSVPVKYDVNMTWLVDVDYYINVLLHEKNGYYISSPIVYFSHNEVQLTNLHFNNKATEIKESLILWEKYGVSMMQGILNYDTWWRMIRNLNIRSAQEFDQYTAGLRAPGFIYDIISFQRKIPFKTLQNPIVSKLSMAFCYRFIYLKNQ